MSTESPTPAKAGTPLYSIREGRRDKFRAIVAELNNTSPECLEAVDGLQIMELEDKLDALQSRASELERALEGDVNLLVRAVMLLTEIRELYVPKEGHMRRQIDARMDGLTKAPALARSTLNAAKAGGSEA